ncbi:hypothetical protein M5D96_010569 [Drosophila gunungcola]|uniref:Uncharacterized protein n=1 Tax=Drosophila gunungcola TaxID=103775 RepID=A0A9P9YGY0_9MUSC|nr:hypothetical protein M5D96_010569 [Drosophila gunungcola]
MEVQYVLDRILLAYRIATSFLAKFAINFYSACWKQSWRNHDKASGLRTGLAPPSSPTQGGECTTSLPLTSGLQQPQWQKKQQKQHTKLKP